MEAERKEVLAKISTLSCVDEEVTRLLAEAQSAASRAVVMRGSEHPGYEDQLQLRMQEKALSKAMGSLHRVADTLRSTSTEPQESVRESRPQTKIKQVAIVAPRTPKPTNGLSLIHI